MESNKTQDLCGYSHEEIFTALGVIKKICRANNCENCPFYKGEECQIGDMSPDTWEFYSPSEVWTAFA